MTSPSASALAAELASLRRQVEALARASQMSRRSVEDGGVKVYDAEGNLRGIIGVQEDGTTALVTVNDPTPPTPSAPIVFPVPGGLEVTWDGTFLDYAGQPSDFGKLEVHAYTEDVYTPTEATRCAILPAAGTVTVDLPADAYTVVFVAYSTGGTPSAPSLGATETPADAGEDAVARQTAADAQAAAAQAVLDAAKAAQDAATANGSAAQAQADAAQAILDASAASEAADAAQADAAQGIADADAAAQAASAASGAASKAQTDAAKGISDAAAAAQAASAAQGTASSALTAANGKTRIYTQSTKPTGGTYADGDIWRDTANGYRLSVWSASSNDWLLQTFGSGALSAGAVTATVLAGDAIDGKTVTGATVRTATSGARVEMNSGGVVGYNASGPVTTISATDGSITSTKGTLTGAVVRTSASGQRVEMNSGGVVGYNSAGTPVTTISSTDGSITSTAGTITGATVRTAASGQRVELVTGGLIGRDSTGTAVTTISSTDGSITSTKGTLTGAVVRTAASGQRVEMNSGGLIGYDSTGTPVTTISSTDGSITSTKGTLTGAVVRTAASGARIELDSTNGLRGISTAGATKTQVGTDGTLTAVDASLTGSLRTVDSGTGVALVSGTGSLLGRGVISFPDAADGGNTPPLLVREVATSTSTLTMWGSNKYTAFPTQPYVSVREYAAGYFTAGDPATSEVIINGSSITLGGHSHFRQRAWHFNRTGADTAFASGSLFTVQAATITGAPLGDWVIGYRLVVSNNTVAAGFTNISINGNLTADATPRADCQIVNGRFTFFQTVAVNHTGGDMVIRGHYTANAGTATAWTQGTQLTAQYLGPRSAV